MNKDQIFIGDIKKCIDVETKVDFGEYYTEYSCDCTLIPVYISETYKKNVYLYKIKDNKYIDLSELNSYLDFIKINHNKVKNNMKKASFSDAFVNICSSNSSFTNRSYKLI